MARSQRQGDSMQNDIDTYGEDLRCVDCREHLADPHAPECPRGDIEDAEL